MWYRNGIFLEAILVCAITASASAQIEPLKVPLDGEWMFSTDTGQVGISEGWHEPSFDRSSWRKVSVPAFWEKYPGLGRYDGIGWFARTFFFEKTAESFSIWFAGIDDDAIVWVNGVQVGAHTGYSEAFALDVTAALQSGENLIVIQVRDHSAGGGIYKAITLVETRHVEDMLKSPYYGKQARRSADWVKDGIIYEVYLRSFSREGTFAGLEKKIPDLRDLGVNIIWLMPIHPVGEKKRKGTLGSPYAVRDFYGINPEFGSMDDFKRLLDTVHKNGMKLIIDLVANHTSWDSKLIEAHPEWFTRDSSGAIVPPNPDWFDVADLDFSHGELRRYMIDMMVWWVRDVGIDGFRCDIAELVPTAFWEEVRDRLDRIKPVLMLSEGSLPEHHMKAFDITYAWTIYDVLASILAGTQPVTILDDIFKREGLQYPTGALRLRFNSNHDKNAWDAPAAEKFGEDGLRLTAVLVNTLPGVPLLFNGDEVANPQRLDLFEQVPIAWTAGSETTQLYRKLGELRKQHKALSRGVFIRVASDDPDRVYAFFRIAGNDRVIAVMNFGIVPRTVTLEVPWTIVFPGQRALRLVDAFSGESIPLEANEGGTMILSLEPRGYRVFTVGQ
ncbi:MAG: alpha-amylase family glycosyl hydrolase [Ignavibacteria bacterium]|nr:alpha-amylase family glycosyl hydrolase [Ignavibacteria bacterium]